MKPSECILKTLKELKVDVIKPLNSRQETVDFIYKSLLSKKFRKYSVNPDYQKHILNAIEINVAKNDPIKLTLVFGGYKLWRLEEAPEVDWAELFTLTYYTQWLKPILAAYKPGVWFDFFLDDVILEIMNNIPKVESEKYLASFKNFLSFIKPYLPENFNFTVNRVGDQYESYEDFKKDLDLSIEKVRVESENLILTPKQIATIDLNVKLKPGQDKDPQWREKVNLIHEGYQKVSGRRPYYRTPEKILVTTGPIKDSLSIGTTKRSVVKFWIGAGVLEKIGEEYVTNIFSPRGLFYVFLLSRKKLIIII